MDKFQRLRTQNGRELSDKEILLLASIAAGIHPLSGHPLNIKGLRRYMRILRHILCKKVSNKFNHAFPVFHQQREQATDDRTQKRIEKLKSAVRYLVCALLGALFAHFVLPSLIFG